MKSLLIAILTLGFLNSSAQRVRFKVFKKTEYINGNFYREMYDTITSVDEKLDIYFLKRHFYSPYYLPDKFVDKQKRNKKISIWRDPNGKKDQQNWENVFTYDNLGRVISYSYSGCFICSDLPYNYNVTYNANGLVAQITETKNMVDKFKFYYDGQGVIVKFEKYLIDKLEQVIVLVD